jgi:hypothetical protein
MDAMERYYTSDTTQENVLALADYRHGATYLVERDQPVVPMTPGVANSNGSTGETAAAKNRFTLPAIKAI